MGPSVRNLLRHYRLDPNTIVSTGPYETLLKCDVLSYINKNQLQPSKPGETTDATVKPQRQSMSYVPNLDTKGYTPPNTGPKGFSQIARKLLDV